MNENDNRCLPPIDVQRMLARIRAYEDFATGMSIDAAAEKHGVLRSELQETIRIDFQDKLDNLAHGVGDFLGKRTPLEIQEIRSWILQRGVGLVPFESMVEGARKKFSGSRLLMHSVFQVAHVALETLDPLGFFVSGGAVLALGMVARTAPAETARGAGMLTGFRS